VARARVWLRAPKVGLDIGRQLALQLGATLVIGAYTAVATVGCLKVAELACGGLRVTEKEEFMGLDRASHDEDGYDMPGSMSLA
jgi:ammonia channel protein AmtB